MRSVKVGASHTQEKCDRPSSDRKLSTASKSTAQSLQNQHFDKSNSAYNRKELNEYKQLFDMFDTDCSGAIGNEELKEAMFSIGMHANEAEIDNVIREASFDHQYAGDSLQ
nr:EF hand domain containing protein [Haemonchus contortus]